MPDEQQMIKRQQVLADFGDLALRSEYLDEVLNEACRLVGAALGTDRAKILEIQEGGSELLMRAGVGWGPNVVGQVRLQMSERSSETFSIQEGKPVISQDIRTEERFEIPDFMKDAGVVAMVNVPIFVPGRKPYGLLQVDANRPREFGQDDIEFLRTYATILGPVIDRLQKIHSLNTSEERFKAFVTASSDVVYRMSPDWSEMRQLDGRGFLDDVGSPNEDWLEAYILPEDRPVVLSAIAQAISAKHIFELEHRVRRAGGSIGWTLSRAVPILNREGEIIEWLGAAANISSRKETEAALRASEERFAQFAASSSDALWIRDAATLAMEYISPAVQTIYGVPPETLLGGTDKWTALIVPEDREMALAHLQRAREGESTPHEFRVRRRSDGDVRWIRDTDFPLRDAQGRVQRIGGIAQDVTEAKRAANRQEVLVAELQHRTRNLLGVVQAMFEDTLQSTGELDAFTADYRDRLRALGRVQGLLSRLGNGDRVTFDALIRDEMRAIGAPPEGDRVTLDGPAGVALRSGTVQTFALAIHELATNALKYGALRQPAGRLAIAWRLAPAGQDGRPWLHVDWRESGVAMPSAGSTPKGTGQGRQLIEQALPYQLGAITTYVMASDGVRCSIAVPVSSRTAAGETEDDRAPRSVTDASSPSRTNGSSPRSWGATSPPRARWCSAPYPPSTRPWP